MENASWNQEVPIETDLSFSTNFQDFFQTEKTTNQGEDRGDNISFPYNYGSLNSSFLNTTHDEFNFHLYTISDDYLSTGYMCS